MEIKTVEDLTFNEYEIALNKVNNNAIKFLIEESVQTVLYMGYY